MFIIVFKCVLFTKKFSFLEASSCFFYHKMGQRQQLIKGSYTSLIVPEFLGSPVASLTIELQNCVPYDLE